MNGCRSIRHIITKPRYQCGVFVVVVVVIVDVSADRYNNDRPRRNTGIYHCAKIMLDVVSSLFSRHVHRGTVACKTIYLRSASACPNAYGRSARAMITSVFTRPDGPAINNNNGDNLKNVRRSARHRKFEKNSF